ncbi:hypothetical protein VTK73DRAFT_6143 [Phialemonium thermophilum]|uniref:Uncharacterized protein n=1 Tax=Phialemonium thermophilum TaxID=223376 RepID=A0ABR3V055_9PEZI
MRKGRVSRRGQPKGGGGLRRRRNKSRGEGTRRGKNRGARRGKTEGDPASRDWTGRVTSRGRGGRQLAEEGKQWPAREVWPCDDGRSQPQRRRKENPEHCPIQNERRVQSIWTEEWTEEAKVGNAFGFLLRGISRVR